MAVRIALLILVTSAFVVAWSGDDALCPSCKNANPTANQRQVPGPPESTSPSSVPLTRSFQIPEIPLPAEITAGTYLVADQFGQTQVRIVSSDEVASKVKSSAKFVRDHYQVTHRQSRYHYIRIVSLPDHDLAGRPLATGMH